MGGILAAWFGYILNCKGKSDPLLIVLNRSMSTEVAFLAGVFLLQKSLEMLYGPFFRELSKYCVILASQFECSLGWTNTSKAHSVLVFFFPQVTPVYSTTIYRKRFGE